MFKEEIGAIGQLVEHIAMPNFQNAEHIPDSILDRLKRSFAEYITRVCDGKYITRASYQKYIEQTSKATQTPAEYWNILSLHGRFDVQLVTSGP